MLSAPRAPSGTGSTPPTPVFSLGQPPSDPWAPAQASLPSEPRTSNVVFVPAEWQRAADIGPLWQQWIASVPDGSAITFPAGLYSSRDSLEIKARNDLIIQGPSSGAVAEIRLVGDGSHLAKPAQRSALIVHSSHRVVVEHLTIVGANPNGAATNPYQNPFEGQHGITVTWDSSDVRVSDNRISHTYGDGISTQGRSTRVLIENNIIRDVGRQGISSIDAFDSTIRSNDVTNTAVNGIDVEPNRAGARVAVMDNRLAGKGATLAALGPILSDVEFTDNHVTGALKILLYAWPTPDGSAQRLTRIVVSGNTGSIAVPAESPGVEALNVDFLTLDDNQSGGTPASAWLMGACPVRLPSRAMQADHSAIRFAPVPSTGSARQVEPDVVLGIASDRVNPVPGIEAMYSRTRGRGATSAEIVAAASRICRGMIDRWDLGAELLAGWHGPAANQADRVAAAVLTTGAMPTESAALTNATSPEQLGAQSPARVASYHLMRDVTAAFIVAHGRPPDAHELAAWTRSARAAPYNLSSLIRAVSAQRAPSSAAGACTPRPCTAGLADPELVALVSPVPPLVSLGPGC